MSESLTTELLRRYRPEAAGATDPAPVVLICAHPDDETISAGALLARFPVLHLAWVTDGAPRDGRDAAAAGCRDWREYAALRRVEAAAALRAAGIHPRSVSWLEYPDQQAAHRLRALVCDVRSLIRRIRPALVITHPYEGGHPDHDAAAFAVAQAIDTAMPLRLEFASYHAAAGALRTGRFLEEHGREYVHVLSLPERERKRRMLACFASQQATLALFDPGVERLRPALSYDFTRPPHPPPLYYERFPWGINAARWCALAREALREVERAAC